MFFEFVLPIIMFLFNFCHPFLHCFGAKAENPEHWERIFHRVLVETPCETLGISEHVRRGLLHDDNDEVANVAAAVPALEWDNIIQDHIIFRGLPNHPLYKTLSQRLCQIHCARASHTNKSNKNTPVVDPNDDKEAIKAPPYLIPAKEFGFEEETPSMYIPLPARLDSKHVIHWFQRVGDVGIFTLLGLRATVGTEKVLPPSWYALLQAADQQHRPNSTLTVAARALAKHAHRGQQQFFGQAKGPPAQQNEVAHQVLLRLLQQAAWINIHTFVGTQGKPSLEVRVESGYGARWVADWSLCDSIPTEVEFRGFLEPQMEDGHLKGWKHA